MQEAKNPMQHHKHFVRLKKYWICMYTTRHSFILASLFYWKMPEIKSRVGPKKKKCAWSAWSFTLICFVPLTICAQHKRIKKNPGSEFLQQINLLWPLLKYAWWIRKRRIKTYPFFIRLSFVTLLLTRQLFPVKFTTVRLQSKSKNSEKNYINLHYLCIYIYTHTHMHIYTHVLRYSLFNFKQKIS